jgi:bis(5'-adenosyl)-triphosphatase
MAASLLVGASVALGESLPFGGRLSMGASKVLLASPTGLAVAYSKLRPVLPGHSIVTPTRAARLLSDLTSAEVSALFDTVMDVQNLNIARLKAEAHNIALYDGEAAGQPLPHVHVHVVPRIAGDLANNDDIYSRLARWSPEGPENTPPPFHMPDDAERRARTKDDMAAEASRYAASAESGEPLPSAPFPFGPFELDESQCFYATQHCVAIVNLKPLCPGHVLVVPKRLVPVLGDLLDEERHDLWRTVQAVQALVMDVHGAVACQLGVQDGRAAGQSVPHAHVHVLPHQLRE